MNHKTYHFTFKLALIGYRQSSKDFDENVYSAVQRQMAVYAYKSFVFADKSGIQRTDIFNSSFYSNIVHLIPQPTGHS